MGLRLLVVGMVGLVAVCDWHGFSGAVARQAREALGRTVVIEGDLDADGTWPPLMRAEPVQMGVFDWSWIKGYWCGRRARPLAARCWSRGIWMLTGAGHR